MGRLIKQTRKKSVIILEKAAFIWDEPELEELAVMWDEGVSIVDMAKLFDKAPVEILLAVIHLALEQKIKPRTGGLFWE